MAYPEFRVLKRKDIRKSIDEQMGMDALEVIYPYFQEGSVEFPTLQHEKEVVKILHELAKHFELEETSGFIDFRAL